MAVKNHLHSSSDVQHGLRRAQFILSLRVNHWTRWHRTTDGHKADEGNPGEGLPQVVLMTACNNAEKR
jgi:hypothetical protein